MQVMGCRQNMRATQKWKNFYMAHTISIAIDQAEKLAKDREGAIGWCEKTLLYEKRLLEKSPQSVGALDKVKHLVHTITQLKRNVNTKLVFEHLFFRIRSLAKPETIG